MIERVLGVHRGDADAVAAAVQRLVDERRSEDQVLEFKERVTADTMEIAKDVAAMANGGGGLVIYGVAESDTGDGVADAFTVGGVAFTESTRIRAVVGARVAPWMQLDIREVAVPGVEGAGVLVVVVEGSSRPYAVTGPDNALRYPRRHGRETAWMDESEVGLMYQDRHRLIGQAGDRLTRVIADANRRMAGLSPQVPTVRISGAPVSPQGTLYRLNDYQEARAVATAGGSDVLGYPTVPLNMRVGFQRIDLVDDDKAVDGSGWVSVYQDGSWMVALRNSRSVGSTGGEPRFGFGENELTERVIARIVGVGRVLSHIGASGEYRIRAELIPGAKTPAHLEVPRSLGFLDEGPNPVSYPEGLETSGFASDLATAAGAVRLAGRLLNDLMSAWGQYGSRGVTPDGVLRAAFFGNNSAVRQWAESAGVPCE